MGTNTKVESDPSPIIFFDGICNLCNSAVQFVIKYDKKRNFKLAPLQSAIASSILEKRYLQLNSIVLVVGNKVYTKSDAVLQVSKKLRFPIPFLYIFIIVPRFLRDFVYEYIAKNRYAWFGKKATCMIPTEEIKERFL